MGQLRVEAYDLYQFDTLPEQHGLYAWYLRALTNSDEREYHKFFKQKTLRTTAKNFLAESYSGHLEADMVDLRPVRDRGLLAEVSSAFCPPLYIGIAEKQTLRDRLNDHRKTLQRAIDNPPARNIAEVEEPSTDAFNVFANRVGVVLSELPSISLASFFVRIIAVPDSYDSGGIRDTEHYLNRTFIPLYGRR